MSNWKFLDERDCTNHCRCEYHGELICAALTKRDVSDMELCAFLESICCSCATVKDTLGRTALHVAASCGRSDVVKWLIQTKHANINTRDCESGYTALHRSIFYGKINVAVYLIKAGANLSSADSNGLTYTEHAMKDCERFHIPNVSEGEVYVWGCNTNYTFGFQQTHSVPELLDSFHKNHPNISIRQICLEKFHCVLVSTDDKVFACGHGQGGRLGISTNKTIVVPKEVKFTASGHTNVVCKKVSIASDHSVFLMDSGHIWTCGLNTHHVLGFQPPPNEILTPKPLAMFQCIIEDVCAARYHTVAWGPKGIYTWGLHGGQLGHDKSDQKYIVSPKLITCLGGGEYTILSVATSNGAVAAVTSKGDVYVFYEYQCRKIASKQLSISNINAVGGKLCCKILNTKSSEDNCELIVAGLSKDGNLYVWRESDTYFARCIFSTNRLLIIRQIAINLNEMLLVTQQGQAFRGSLKRRKRNILDTSPSPQKSAFHTFLEKDNCHTLKITKIPHIHRAISIHSDINARNYAAIQVNPNHYVNKKVQITLSSIQHNMQILLEGGTKDDLLHDVIFKVAEKEFFLHRFIIATSKSNLNELVFESSRKCVLLQDIHPDIFQQLLQFIYTGSCDLLQVGPSTHNFDANYTKVDEKVTFNDNNKNPIRMLQEAAKKFQIKPLQKILEYFYYDKGIICIKKLCPSNVALKFNYKEFPKLYDAVLKTKDKKEIYVHKCILAARLEYFNNLFSTRWNLSSAVTEISLPFSASVVEDLVEFLYTDELPSLNKKDTDHLCNLLIVSDQLFVTRLKKMCESELSNFVNLKNIVQILCFSTMYNAEQLKTYCMEFVCVNLSAVLELKCLELIDEGILNNITEFYCKFNSIMQQRIITPYSNAPSDELIFKTANCCQIEFDVDSTDIKPTTRIHKRRTRIRKHTLNSTSKSLSDSDNILCEENHDNNEAEKYSDSSKREENVVSSVQCRVQAIISAQDTLNSSSMESNFNKLSHEPTSSTISLDDFPGLGMNRGTNLYSRSPSKEDNFELKQKFVKMSQKQRKRLASESNANTTEHFTAESDGKNVWNLSVHPLTPVGSPNSLNTVESIILNEKRQKENLFKMKSKLLMHTQMEDKAIEDLYKFYNVNYIFDEEISISRVQAELVALPVWVNLSKIK